MNDIVEKSSRHAWGDPFRPSPRPLGPTINEVAQACGFSVQQVLDVSDLTLLRETDLKMTGLTVEKWLQILEDQARLCREVGDYWVARDTCAATRGASAEFYFRFAPGMAPADLTGQLVEQLEKCEAALAECLKLLRGQTKRDLQNEEDIEDFISNVAFRRSWIPFLQERNGHQKVLQAIQERKERRALAAVA